MGNHTAESAKITVWIVLTKTNALSANKGITSMTPENRARNVHNIVSLAKKYKMRKSNVKVVNKVTNSTTKLRMCVSKFVEMESQHNIHVTKSTNSSSVVAHVTVWSNLISSAKWKIN